MAEDEIIYEDFVEDPTSSEVKDEKGSANSNKRKAEGNGSNGNGTATMDEEEDEEEEEEEDVEPMQPHTDGRNV
jgi:hypothetical protein